jgi:hypothetical protein
VSSALADQQKKLANLSIVLGSLYVGAAAIFLFGAFAAGSVRRLLTALSHSQIPYSPMQRRLGLIRIFSFLSAAVAVIIIASGFLRTVVHFILKVRILYSGTVNFGLTDCYRKELPDKRMHCTRHGAECGHYLGCLELGP